MKNQTLLNKNIVNKKNISDQIFEVMKNRIICGDYEEGCRLPGENELADIFGVSRMTARVVFQKLSSIGLVEIRNGEGTFAKRFNLNNYLADTLTLINNENTTENISEFRKYFEPMCTELACLKRTDNDIEILTGLYADMLKSAESPDIKDFFKADYKFHLYICEISNNPIIKMIYELLMNIIEKHYEETMQKFAIVFNYSFNIEDENYVIRKNAIMHQEILDDIKNGNNKISKRRWLNLNKQYDATTLD